MGGNAAKLHNPQRLNTEDAIQIGKVYSAYLRLEMRVYEEKPLASVVKSYSNKETHGDIDIIVCNSILKHKTIEEIVKAVSVFEGHTETFPFYKNGPVVSIANYLDKERTQCFQVDLIFVPEEDYAFSVGYFAYNDLGNLIGRVAHNMGLKFGHDGLWYPFKGDENYLFKDICVSKDFNKVISFLGFCPNDHSEGFSDLEQIYEYVCRGDYFNRDLYPLEHRSNKARVRDRKRPTYTNFLKYLDEHPEIPNRLEKYPECKNEWIGTIFQHFPEFEIEYNTTMVHFNISQICKQKLNGADYTRITGLTGKDLGSFIRKFREDSGLDQDSQYKEYIYMTDKYLIEMDVEHFYKEVYPYVVS